MEEDIQEEIDVLPHYHKKIDNGCTKIAKILKEIWPLVQEHCGNHLEIDMGSIKARIGPEEIIDEKQLKTE